MLCQPALRLLGQGIVPECLGPVTTSCLHGTQRGLHGSHRVGAKKSNFISASSRKAKNMEFVKRWNKENSALFGPKLNISKNTLKKRAEAAQLVIDNVSHEEAYQTENSEQVFRTDPPDPSKKAETKEVKPKPQRPKPVAEAPTTPAHLSELDGILRFPLFCPNSDIDNLTGSMLVTDIPLLREQTAPRVTRILDQTKSEQSQFVLNRWIKQQIELLGKKGFGQAQQKRLRAASTLHGCVEQFLMGTPEHLLNLDDHIAPCWSSLQSVLGQVEEVLGVEVKVEHEQLRYTGTADCIATYKGELCVIDWKTSSKPRASVGDLYDYPLQVAAYLGALGYNRLEEHSDKQSQAENLLIVVAYEDGTSAHAHFIPRRQVMKFWGEWTRRLHQYWNTTLSKQS